MSTVLIIDDEPAVARLIARVAEDCGYAARLTSDPEEFKDLAVTANPKLIVLDLAMPGPDGVELLRYLAAVKCESQILIMSGFDARVLETTGRLGEALGLRIAGTLAKPVRVTDLRARMSDLQASFGQ